MTVLKSLNKEVAVFIAPHGRQGSRAMEWKAAMHESPTLESLGGRPADSLALSEVVSQRDYLGPGKWAEAPGQADIHSSGSQVVAF